jgi:hypothetical protein
MLTERESQSDRRKFEEDVMAEDHRTQIKQDAGRIIEWLGKHQTEFEGEGVDENSLASAVGMAENEVTEAVDYLENHEDVVRFPHPLASPPRLVLKPGRNWPEIREEAAGGSSKG